MTVTHSEDTKKDECNMNEQDRTPRDWLNECRRILGTDDRTATYWDTNMTDNEKRVILQAAGIATHRDYLTRKFKSWPEKDQKRIKEAAKRASKWAESLHLGAV
jgi:hypothetical protein